jgi:hypothetical protein
MGLVGDRFDDIDLRRLHRAQIGPRPVHSAQREPDVA